MSSRLGVLRKAVGTHRHRHRVLGIGARCIHADRIPNPVLMQKRPQGDSGYRRAVLEYGVQANDRHVPLRESRADALRLR